MNRNAISTLLAGLLGIAFVVLKLTGVIAWSWWLVTLPFWIGPALLCAFVVLAAIMVAADRIVNTYGRKKR